MSSGAPRDETGATRSGAKRSTPAPSVPTRGGLARPESASTGLAGPEPTRSDPAREGPGPLEFTLLLAVLMGLVALSIDLMLPALGDIARELDATSGNVRQGVIACLFVGLGIGQLVFGPVSDAVGRRPAIFAGTALFVAGAVLAALAETFETMLWARALQGFGAAGPRLVSVAMVRDRLEGRAMAKLLSTVMTVFVLAPIVAPSLGQAALHVVHWRELFVILGAFAFAAAAWLAVRQPETLARRSSLRLRPVARAFAEVLRSRRALLVTASAACVYGSLMGYVYSSQQLFQQAYGVGDRYGPLFGVSALFIAAGTFANARIVGRLGMERICRVALAAQGAWALLWLGWTVLAGAPSLGGWLAFSAPTLFLAGLVFGNFNALALEPLGHVAGTASAVVASVQTFLGTAIAATIGAAWSGDARPLVAGYALCACVALGCLVRSGRPARIGPVVD